MGSEKLAARVWRVALAISMLALLFALPSCKKSQEEAALKEEVMAMLAQKTPLSNAALEVEVEGNKVIIRGELTTPTQQKQLAGIVAQLRKQGLEVENLTQMQELDSGLINEDAYGVAPGLGL